jgi:hypothetical protein
MSPRPRKQADHCAEQQCEHEQETDAHSVFVTNGSTRIGARDMVEEVDWDDEEEEDHEGYDCHDKGFDTVASVVDFYTSGFAFRVLGEGKGVNGEILRMRLGIEEHTFEQKSHWAG